MQHPLLKYSDGKIKVRALRGLKWGRVWDQLLTDAVRYGQIVQVNAGFKYKPSVLDWTLVNAAERLIYIQCMW
jgi:hypothetical protein